MLHIYEHRCALRVIVAKHGAAAAISMGCATGTVSLRANRSWRGGTGRAPSTASYALPAYTTTSAPARAGHHHAQLPRAAYAPAIAGVDLGHLRAGTK
jgi:hypothetical protein